MKSGNTPSLWVTSMNLSSPTADSGFYEGFNTTVTISSKILVALRVVWAAVFPDGSRGFLNEIRDCSFAVFGAWYICTIALCPHDEPPEFSWF
jgi:hypothetical protein